MSIKDSGLVLRYLIGKGYVSVDKIAEDVDMSVNKAYFICKNNNENISQKGRKGLFKYFDSKVVRVQIIEYLKVNNEVSLEDLCKFCDLGKGLILSICRNDDNVVRRDIYDSNDGRITLFRYNEF